MKIAAGKKLRRYTLVVNMHIIADWKRTNFQCYALRPHVSDTTMRRFLEALARRHRPQPPDTASGSLCLFFVASILMCTYSHGTVVSASAQSTKCYLPHANAHLCWDRILPSNISNTFFKQMVQELRYLRYDTCIFL
jgi:hypothetical protein